MIHKFEHAFTAGSCDFAGLDRAISNCLEAGPVPQGTAAQVMIAFDELISNILNNRDDHDSIPDQQDPQLIVEIEIESGRIDAEVRDNGPQFDPLTIPEPDTDLSVEERELGGLGVHLVRNLMDDVTYSRKNGWNRLRFSKTFVLK